MSRTFQIDFEMLGSAKDYFHDLKRPVGRAGTAAIRRAGGWAKDEVRREVRRRFRDHPNRGAGQSLANSVRHKDYYGPREFSYKPASVITANASWAEIFEEGGRVFPHGDVLIYPTETGEDLKLDRGMVRIGSRSYFRKKSQVDQAARLYGPLFEIEDGSKKYIAASHEEVYGTPGDPVALFHVRHWVPEKKRLSFYDTAEKALRLVPNEWDKAFRKYTR